MSTTKERSYYRIYLLTIWVEEGRDDGESANWRFRLQDPRSGQQHCFANLTEFVVALHGELVETQQQFSEQ